MTVHKRSQITRTLTARCVHLLGVQKAIESFQKLKRGVHAGALEKGSARADGSASASPRVCVGGNQ